CCTRWTCKYYRLVQYPRQRRRDIRISGTATGRGREWLSRYRPAGIFQDSAAPNSSLPVKDLRAGSIAGCVASSEPEKLDTCHSRAVAMKSVSFGSGGVNSSGDRSYGHLWEVAWQPLREWTCR